MGNQARLQCPVCQKCYAEPMKFCPEHGQPLVPLVTGYRGGSVREPIGQLIGDKYRVLERIGEGGMGAVYRVEHQDMGKQLAMKLLHANLSSSEQAVVRFQREAKAASTIVHPHVIRVWDSGITEDGRFFLVMELLSGKDLFDVLKEERILPPERTINILRQVCAGLDEAHRLGIIHRDMKIENVFLSANAEFPEFVKILDFGIAKWLHQTPDGRTLTATGVVFGTPEYLSPEQAAGLEIDHRADLYSLGIIAYRMLAGTLPFYEQDKQKLIQQQLHQLPLPFADRRMPQEVPADLEAIVFKLLAKDPDDRFQTADEVKQALERVVFTQPIHWVEY
ncbi:MAG: serine/threonine-protein kinase [Myxococcota bacterium]|nr:serine/threonine-protein kinase [Myxococcota bacterium]